MDNTLPKKIWFLWLQGLDNAPLLVRNCYGSWVRHNPGWELMLLDENNVRQYITPVADGRTKQALSDILRINLLAEYGGVWVDATCFCTKPLDEWLYSYMDTGFFAFERPGPDRMISSWFIAAAKYNYIATTYKNTVNKYWAMHPDLVLITDSRWKKYNKYIERRGTQIWFNYLVTDILKVHAYFWFHYLFERLYLRDANFRAMWDATPKLSADEPHIISPAKMYSPLTGELKAHIDGRLAPVYKLNWRVDVPEDISGTAVGYLYSPAP